MGRHGSPRLHADLRDAGWTVSDSMRRQGLVARRIKRRNGLTRQDKTKTPFPDLLERNFTADRPNARWVGDIQCRHRHWMSYAELRTMPTLLEVAQFSDVDWVGRSA
ncbi:MAG: hypothetical protein JNL54_21315 [Kineosporiaceae bacterium]|nr:hypothetical protein [Kineosporiaceae bacterium]